ncbi:hypothetical protein P7C70_g4888, partial [Phenoliferia sp. Uapishka_3]
MFAQEIADFRRLGVRHYLNQALKFATVISTALMMWKGLSIIANTESPIVVVLSESMEPAIQNDFPKIKYALLGILGVGMLFNREE